MKKILHIVESFGSGVFNYVKNLSTWQCKDYEVYVAYGIRPETPVDFKEQFDKRVKFERIDGFTREIKISKDLKAFFCIKKIVSRISPDLIHLHSTKAGILGRWAINCNKYKVIYSPHAYSFLMLNCSNCKRRIYREIERISGRKNCITITDIESEYEVSKQVTDNAICIPNGIDLDEMDKIIEQARKQIKKYDKIVVCTLGKVVHQKNPDLFNEIAKNFPDIDFVWIGAGPLEYKLTSPNIIVTGWLNRVEAVAQIMSSNIFLFTSLWESLSIALLEVMYIGKPCIVSNVDGNNDVICSQMNGYICDNKQDYIKTIKMLIDNKDITEVIVKRARQNIIEKFNICVMKKSYQELYERIKL